MTIRGNLIAKGPATRSTSSRFSTIVTYHLGRVDPRTPHVVAVKPS